MARKLEEYPLADLKRVYVLLHGSLAQNPELMDSDLLQDLQTLLQRQARAAGVDVSMHAQWDAWLHGAPSGAL